jgi:integrase
VTAKANGPDAVNLLLHCDAHLVPRCRSTFFVAEQGGRLLQQYVHRVCWRLSREIGPRQSGDHSGPRVHDFRYRFAIRTLLDWHRQGKNVQQQLPALSTYLGHACVRQAGLRLSELISLDRDAVHFGAGAHVRCVGEGRKERTTPLTTLARRALQAWLKEPVRKGGIALFPHVHSGRLGAGSVQSLPAKHVQVAGESCPSLKSKRVSPHVLRHSAAMELLQAGVDCSEIALWLGYESIETTHIYLHAHRILKEAAMAKLKPYQGGNRIRFRPTTDYLPSWRGSERLNYAEWYGANGHATADSASATMGYSGTVRHSLARGINGQNERR